MHRTILLRRAAAGLAVGGGALLGSRLRLHEREVAPPPVYVRSWLRPLTASCEAAAPDGAPDLPVFTKAEVAKHTGGESGVWVSLGNKVYDITDFIANHPGGMEKIRLAAGGSLEPYWSLYRQHVDHTAADGGLVPKEHVAEFLASMHIGWLDPADVASDKKTRSADDPYANEPARHPALVSVSDVPCSAELPREFIMDDWLTPAPLWFVRNHHPVPHLNEADFKLKVHGKGIGQKEYTLDQLKQGFGKTEIAATIQCGGNRRGEFNSERKTSGNEWGFGAISNAKWGGVRLRDVLQDAGLASAQDASASGVEHIHFEGDDGCRVSIPVDKAISEGGDVLLAYEMNGEPIPLDHGAPLRVIVPGHVGVRNTKWLTEIEASHEDAPGMWQRGIAYKVFGPNVTKVTEEMIAATPTMQEMPVQSLIVEPRGGAVVEPGTSLDVRGLAYSGGGRGIIRVDVSGDGGATWQQATLTDGADQPPNRAWAWTFWEAEVPIPAGGGGPVPHTLVCKATDASHNVQPEKVETIWNLRGLSNNAWHAVHVVAEVEKDEA